ncbi:Glycoside hydrolase 2 Mannanase beta-galactosidase [Gurleya vavrai]
MKGTRKKQLLVKKKKRLIKEEKNIAAIKNTSAIIPGKYLKLTIKKTKDIKFDSLTIFGEVNINNKILLQGKVKKQNYFPYTLKSNERYLVSVGWRRESIKVVFSLKDPTRNKYLKYILDSLHCNVNFNNFFVEPGTSFCIIKEKQFDKEKYINNNTEDILNNYKNFKVTDEAYFTDKFFRIAACGNITDVSGKTNMLKKLKLIGYPLKINENTVFVKDMFTSDKEVIKFEGALLRTVSGIRGSIKKGVGLNGVFRATFEGRLLMSDIIFMRCFIPYEICDDYFSNENDNKDGRNINFKDCSENKDSEEKSERRKN